MPAIEEIEVVHPHPIKNGFWHMPKTFYAVFFIEFWERFAFYGLQSLAVLFFIQKFNLSESESTNLFSTFSALLYGLLVIGGYLGDKILGLRRTYLLGMIFLTVGYSSFGYVNEVGSFYWGMGLILVGNIFFKTNAGNYVSRCFKPNDRRLDSAFTYFYMSINLGSLVSMILIPLIASKTSYSFAISLCGVGMFIALLSFFLLNKHFVKGDNPLGKGAGRKSFLMIGVSLAGVVFSYFLGLMLQHAFLSNALMICIAIVIFIVFFMLRSILGPMEQKGMWITFILLVQSIFFWVMYMQMSTSLTLFAVHNVRTELFGFTFPPAITQSFNPFYIFLLSPILASIYFKSEDSKYPISIPMKYATGILVCGLAYILLAVSCFLHDETGTISLIWLFLGYGLYSLGELLISAIGLSMVSKLMPMHLGGFAQAIWFVTSAIGQEIGGWAAAIAAVENTGSSSNLEILGSYQILFGVIGTVATLLSFVLFVFVKKLSRDIEEVLNYKTTV